MKSKCCICFIVFGLSLPLCYGQQRENNFYQQALQESLIPIHAGIPEKIPFWNTYSMRFIYAPAFEFRSIADCGSYRFRALSFSSKQEYTFCATTPWASLSPIWENIPVGETFLTVEALDPDGNPVALSGERKFYRAAVFDSPCNIPKKDYNNSSKKVLQYIFNLDSVQSWLREKTPDPKYTLYCYPSKSITAVIEAMILYAQQEPQNHTKAMQIAERAADYLISQSEPENAPLAFWPPTYAGDELTAKHNKGKIMTSINAKTGQVYLDLYDATGKEKYLEAAKGIANTFQKTQLPSGTWYTKMLTDGGRPDVRNLSIPIEIITFLDRMVKQHNCTKYQESTNQALEWILVHPVKTYNWEGQFEDVNPGNAYKEMSLPIPSFTAVYLLQHADENPEYIPMAEDIIRFVEDQFIVWKTPLPYAQRGETTRTWHTPSALEQYSCYTPISSCVANAAIMFETAYEVTHKKMYRAKARTLANSLIAKQNADGYIPTGWDTCPPTRIKYWWVNSAVYDAIMLGDLGKKFE